MLMHFGVSVLSLCVLYVNYLFSHCLPPGFLFCVLFDHPDGSMDYVVIQHHLLEF
jgi:hypothetical protein